MAITCVGLNHKTAPLHVLERLAVTPSELPKALARLVDAEPVHEGVVLSTCNRVEVYATVHRFHPAVGAVRDFFSDHSGVAPEEIAGGLYTYYDDSAVRHLFEVAAGVDSMVVGESQILGQVREAFQAAADEGTARRLLSTLLQRALRVGKRARSETAIARHVVSLPQAAAREAAALSGIDAPRGLVIGAGRMGELAARAALDAGVSSLVICNRTPDRAELLAQRVGAVHAGFDALGPRLHEADVVLAVTSAPDPVVDREMLASAVRGREHPLVVIDLGLPRNVAPSARDLDGLVLRDMDDLKAVVEEGARRRRAEVPKVRAIVDEEVEGFCAWERSLALGPSIARLTDWAEGIREGEVAKTSSRLGLDDDGRERLEALTRRIVNKLLHRPITQIKDLVAGADGQVYLEAFQELLDPDPGATDD